MRREPVFNAPTAILGLVAAFVLVHGIRALLPAEDDAYVVLALGFIPARYGDTPYPLPGGDIAAVTSFITYMFVHGDVLHLIVNSAWLLAFGTPLVRRMGSIRFIVFSAVCGIAGALVFWALNPGLLAPMVGASGAISGMMGGLLRFLFNAMDNGNGLNGDESNGDAARMGFGQMLRDRRVVLTIGVWILLNFALSLGFASYGEPAAIAWEAHLGGFFAGLLTFGFFDPVAHAAPQDPNSPPLQ
ncbi:MAG: rhomboid family intramembrane serine protease [Proteobacteria bacterium]|nr:MAG: rhomboid family intramembrane serine protease [Pseudomonadota bacterium]